MNDFINSEIDALVMGVSQPTSQQITSDRTTGETTIATLPTAQSLIASSSGDVVPATTFNAEMATQQHQLIAGKIADIDAKLSAVTYDSKTGASLPVITGRDRDILETSRAQLNNEFRWLADRALTQLPKVGDAKAAQQAELEAAARRARDIDTMANTPGSDGKPIGRVRAAQLIDESAQRAKADRLVRGN